MAAKDYPPGIDRGRHLDLSGRARYVWWRRAALLVVAVIPLLALANVFGQVADVSESVSQSGSLAIDSPLRVRGGLLFTSKIVITPRRRLNDAQLYLDNGWFRDMTLNGITPQPSSQSAQGQWQVWDFGTMPAGVAYTIWISWQTDPVNIGTASQTVELYDGKAKLMTTRRTLTIFP